MTRPLRFVILCLGRTGSTHLQSMLDFHSQARCHAEIFGDGKPPTFAGSGLEDPGEFLERMLAGEGERAVGFKLPMKSIRITPEAAGLVSGDPAIAVIRLSRRDRLAQVLSRRMLAATGISQSIFGDYGDATVRIEPQGCIAALESIAADETELDALCAGNEVFRIAYEELGNEEQLVSLQRFLGLDPEPLRSWYEKLQKRPFHEVISNWGELEGALAAAGYDVAGGSFEPNS
jgi:hypothetical protein